MNAILIHILPSLGPVGAWQDDDGLLIGYYPRTELRDACARRVIDLLGARGDNIPVAEWMHRLAERTPYEDDFEVVDIAPGTAPDLAAVLALFIEGWNATSATPTDKGQCPPGGNPSWPTTSSLSRPTATGTSS